MEARPEEEIPLLEHEEIGEDNQGYEETSFIEEQRQDTLDWDSYTGNDPVLFENINLNNDPEEFIRQKTKATRVFFYKLFDEQYDPKFGDTQKQLFNRLDIKTTGINGEAMLLFDGNLVVCFEKGKGYFKEEGSPKYERLEELVKRCNEEFSETPMGKFRDYAKTMCIEYTPDKLIKEYNKRVARRQIRIEKGGNVTISIKWDDEPRLERFKTFVRKNLFLISGAAIAIASAITAVILVMRQSLKRTAKDLSDRVKKAVVKVEVTEVKKEQTGHHSRQQQSYWTSSLKTCY